MKRQLQIIVVFTTRMFQIECKLPNFQESLFFHAIINFLLSQISSREIIIKFFNTHDFPLLPHVQGKHKILHVSNRSRL